MQMILAVLVAIILSCSGAIADTVTCDGISDSTAMLQTALLTGRNVEIPLGTTCLQSDTLTISTPGQKIFGGGKLRQTTNYKANLLITADGAIVDGVTFENTGTADGSNLPTSYGSGVILKSVINAKVLNSTFKNCSSISAGYGSAVWNTGSQGSDISGNAIDGAGIGINTDSYYTAIPALKSFVTKNTVMNSARGYVLDLQGSQKQASTGDILTDNRFIGHTVAGVVIDSTVNGATLRGGEVTGAEISGSSGVVIIHDSNRVIVDGVDISGHGIGVVLNNLESGPQRDNAVINSNIHNNTQDGIQLYGVTQLSLTGNHIYSNGRMGIASISGKYARDVLVSGGFITGNGQDGASLSDPRGVAFDGVSIHGNGTSATNTYSGIAIYKTNLDPADVRVRNVRFFLDFPGYVETQKHAFSNTAAYSTKCRLVDNHYGTQGTASVYDPSGLCAILLP